MGTVSTLEDLLGSLVDSLTDCAGGCGDRLVESGAWRRLPREQRKTLMGLKVNRRESKGRCWKCTYDAKPGVEPVIYPGKFGGGKWKIAPEDLQNIPRIWREIQEAGGATPELGRRLGVSRERARQLVKAHKLPHKDGRLERSAEFLEELEHLAGLGMGVGYIARALRMTPEALVKKVDHLHYLGKTEVKFHGWQERYQKEEAA